MILTRILAEKDLPIRVSVKKSPWHVIATANTPHAPALYKTVTCSFCECRVRPDYLLGIPVYNDGMSLTLEMAASIFLHSVHSYQQCLVNRITIVLLRIKIFPSHFTRCPLQFISMNVRSEPAMQLQFNCHAGNDPFPKICNFLISMFVK